MQFRKMVFGSLLILALAVTAATPAAAIAQQVDEAKSGTEPIEVLRVQTELLRLQPQEELSETPKVGTPSSSGGLLGIMMGGEEGVPEDEHLESWVSRALGIYAQTDDQESRVKQREEIAKGLNKIFDLRHQQRVKELRELEARVQKLKATLEQRAASKTEIVKKRLDYLIREADGLGWGDGIPAPKRSGPTGVGYSTEPLPNQPVSGISGEEATVPKTVRN